MRKRRKRILAAVLAAVMTLGTGTQALAVRRLAGDWKSDFDEWRWEDWNNDGIYECYHYKPNGCVDFETRVTEDGYTINEDAQWVVDGVVQTREQEIVKVADTKAIDQIDTSVPYDPAHPLARVIDVWDLRQTADTNGLNFDYIVNENIHSMLTNQMEYYTDWYDIAWSKGYEEENKAEEYAIYEWFCNWLNSIDFENMTEMERAREIQKVLGSIRYRIVTDDLLQGKSRVYYTLMNQEGQCADYAMMAFYSRGCWD